MPKVHLKELKGYFGLQSDLPYMIEEKSLNKSLFRVTVSYRRKSGGDDFPEPSNSDFFKYVLEKLTGKIEAYGIKKVSASFIPNECP